MKRICVHLSLAAAALAAMMALVAAPASAGTVFCDAQVTTCSQEDIKPSGTQLVTGNINYEGGGITVGPSGESRFSCSDDLMTVKSTVRNGNPMTGELQSAVTAAKCKGWSGTTCSSVTMNSPPTTVAATSEGNGSFEIGSASQPLTISFACNFSEGAKETCSYAATGPVTMTLGWGGADIKEAALKRTAGKALECTLLSSFFKLSVNNVTDGAAPHIAQAQETVLCGQAATNPCPNGQILPAETQLLVGSLYSGDNLTIASEAGKVVDCTNFGLGFKTTESSGQPLNANGSYGSINRSSCTAYPIAGARSCTTATINTPSAAIAATEPGKATIEVGSAAEPLVMSFTCPNYLGFNPVCKYKASGPVTMEVGGVWGTVTVKEEPLVKVEGQSLICGSTAVLSMDAVYNTDSLEIGSI